MRQQKTAAAGHGSQLPGSAERRTDSPGAEAGPQEAPETTEVTGARNEARSFLLACRSALTGPDRFPLGYCQGFIASKLGRLSRERIDDLERRRVRLPGQSALLGSNIMVDIMDIVRSSRFDDRHLGELERRFGRLLTAEDVLDHIIDNLLYVEEY